MYDLINEVITFWLGVFDSYNSIPMSVDLSNSSIFSFFGITGGVLPLGDIMGYLFSIMTGLSFVAVPLFFIFYICRSMVRTIKGGVR